jgi:hypothetical protein
MAGIGAKSLYVVKLTLLDNKGVAVGGNKQSKMD